MLVGNLFFWGVELVFDCVGLHTFETTKLTLLGVFNLVL